MAFFLQYRGLPVPARPPPYRPLPAPTPWIGIVLLTDSRVVYDGSGIDNCRFYRLTTTPTILVLVLGTNRGTATGYSSLGEAWETASGVFSIPGTRGHPFEKNVCVRKMKPVWDEFSAASQTDFTSKMNDALNQTGYLTAAGAAIT